jgi:hypothetical protein
MTDFTASGAPDVSQRHSPPKGEYMAYFAIIFLSALPLACLTWGLAALRQRRLPAKGPIAKAWSQANIITPMIFSA